jgi:hypothetical protein
MASQQELRVTGCASRTMLRVSAGLVVKGNRRRTLYTALLPAVRRGRFVERAAAAATVLPTHPPPGGHTMASCAALHAARPGHELPLWSAAAHTHPAHTRQTR